MPDNATKYLSTIDPDHKEAFASLLREVRENIDPGYKEVATPAPAFVVPLSAFPDGYHCTPGKPLPCINLVSQRTGISLHHFGMYMNPEMSNWFVEAYKAETGRKPDMGKGCIRFKKLVQIPYKLIGQLIGRQSMQEFIEGYEQARSGSNKNTKKRAAS